MNALQKNWVLAGYTLFATEGPTGLKVEPLARKVNKSKSSFYHHFADIEIFTEFLLQYHLNRAECIAVRESQCKNVIPELLEVIVEFKEDILFNRQIRIHRNKPGFQTCLEQVNGLISDAILNIWAEALGIADNSRLAQMVLMLTLENFYLQITPETLTYEWLLRYVQDLQCMVQTFQTHELNKLSRLQKKI
ncbi:MAG: TetR/AcrR family transcriptional regulator [Bacteroidota bacterium]